MFLSISVFVPQFCDQNPGKSATWSLPYTEFLKNLCAVHLSLRGGCTSQKVPLPYRYICMALFWITSKIVPSGHKNLFDPESPDCPLNLSPWPWDAYNLLPNYREVWEPFLITKFKYYGIYILKSKYLFFFGFFHVIWQLNTKLVTLPYIFKSIN